MLGRILSDFFQKLIRSPAKKVAMLEASEIISMTFDKVITTFTHTNVMRIKYLQEPKAHYIHTYAHTLM
jgi:hypothetical protein